VAVRLGQVVTGVWEEKTGVLNVPQQDGNLKELRLIQECCYTIKIFNF
jgi:hypothetical protein